MTQSLTISETSNHSQAEEELFVWTKQWYPVAVAEFLDPKKPHSIQLLGKELVLWRDLAQQWHCFDNFCPHRGVPLSEGRVEADGTLLCAYHAWRFDGQGQCVKIPQCVDEVTEAKHCANEKAAAVVYPTQERQGLIWVWAEAGLVAREESQLRQPRLIPELEEDGDRVVKHYWNIRDLPYGWDFFMENVSDPAHVPVSHHGLVGNRYRDAKYYDMLPIRKMSTQEGFALAVTPVNPNLQEAVHDFQPPCHMRIASTTKDGGKLILALYAIPTRPGWCRHIGCQVFVKDDQGKLPQGLSFFGLPMPIWLGHVLASVFLHQDLVFLHYQEQLLARKSGDKWLNMVYTPNPQDKMVIYFRQWLAQRAGGNIPWFGNNTLPEMERDRAKLFDVWATHTRDCRVCRQALQRVQRAIALCYLTSGICLCLGLMVDARASAISSALNQSFSLITAPPWSFWLLIVIAGLFGLGGYLLQRFSRLFYVYQFEHADND